MAVSVANLGRRPFVHPAQGNALGMGYEDNCIVGPTAQLFLGRTVGPLAEKNRIWTPCPQGRRPGWMNQAPLGPT